MYKINAFSSIWRSCEHLETYQTKPNPSRHSKSPFQRLTLVMLSILRTLPMVRTAVLAFLLATLMGMTASAARIGQVKTRDRVTNHTPTARHAHAAPARPTSSSTRRSSPYSTRNAGRHSAPPARSYTSSRASSHSARRFHGPQFRRAQLSRISRQLKPPTRVSASPTDDPQDPSAPAPIPPAAAPIETASIPATPDEQPIVSYSPPVASLHRPRAMFASPLRGTHDSLVRQNEKSEAEALERIEEDADLEDRIVRGMLVPVPTSAALGINTDLPLNRRYCRPWTATFLSELARAHEVQFHKPLQVSSAVRTVAYQKQLMGVNGNAAAAEGDIVSPHLTGATIDIAKTGLSHRELAWMRVHLLTFQNAGKIDVEEEFRQSCFHITVYKSYVPDRPTTKPRRRAATPPDNGTDGTTPAADPQPAAEDVASQSL